MDTLVSQYPVDPLTSVGNHRTCPWARQTLETSNDKHNKRIITY